jgi:hypothetical protein
MGRAKNFPQGGNEMSEDERAKINQNDEQDDVEAHRKATAAVNEESGQDEGDEDFEAHRKPSSARPAKGV